MEFKEMTYVTENGTVLFSPLGTDQDMGYTITGLASERKYMYLEEIAHHLANTEQRLKRYLDIKLTPEQIQEIDRLYKEKCREAAEKQRAKKVVIEGYNYSIGTRIGSCPVCGNAPLRESGCDYCPKCGQKLDWSVEE